MTRALLEEALGLFEGKDLARHWCRPENHQTIETCLPNALATHETGAQALVQQWLGCNGFAQLSICVRQLWQLFGQYPRALSGIEVPERLVVGHVTRSSSSSYSRSRSSPSIFRKRAKREGAKACCWPRSRAVVRQRSRRKRPAVGLPRLFDEGVMSGRGGQDHEDEGIEGCSEEGSPKPC